MFIYGGPNSTETKMAFIVSMQVMIEYIDTITSPATLLQLYAVCIRKIFLHQFLPLNR